MASPGLKRFEFTVLKDKSSTDQAQVPVSATIAFYRQGATLTAEFSIPGLLNESIALHVDHPGDIREEDRLAVFEAGLSSTYVIVDYVTFDEGGSEWLVYVYNDDDTPLAGVVGARLVIRNDQPLCYPDPLNQGAGETSSSSNSETGRACGYVQAPRFDFIVSIAGQTPRLYPGSDGGYLHNIINARDYPTLQAAIDAAPVGGRVYLPAATYSVPYGGLRITQTLELFGDGSATVLYPHEHGIGEHLLDPQPVIVLDAEEALGGMLGGVHLHDFQMGDTAHAATARAPYDHGISCITQANHKVTHLRIERVGAESLAGDGVHVEGHDIAGGAIVFVYAEAVVVNRCQGSGFYIENATCVELHNCYANGNQLFGGFCLSSQVAWFSCGFEANCCYPLYDETHPDHPESVAAKPGVAGNDYTVDWGAQLRMKLCSPARVESCDFEAFGATDTRTGRIPKTALIIETCGGCLVTNSSFFNPLYGDPPAIDTGCRGIYVSDYQGSGFVTIMPNSLANVGIAIEVGRESQATTVYPQFLSPPASPGVVKAAGARGAGAADGPDSDANQPCL